MRVSVVDWLGWQFIEVSCEAEDGATAADQAHDTYAQCRRALGRFGLTLDDTVRSRLWSVDRAARDAASDIRSATLSGKARAASSSYISPGHFHSRANVGLDLIAVKPRPGFAKAIRENEPPRVPCRYLTVGPLLVLSGQTAVLPTLEIQVTTNILPRITQYLAEARSGWDRVANVSCYMHSSQDPAEMKALFRRMVPVDPPRFEICFVEGYSAEGKLVELEVTAERDI